MKVALETVIDEIGKTLVSASNKLAEHNQVIAQALEDIIALAELCKGLRQRVEALETHVKSMGSVVADIVVACDRERMDQIGPQAPTETRKLPDWAHDFMVAHEADMSAMRMRIYELEKQFEPFKRAFETMFHNELAKRVDGSGSANQEAAGYAVTGLDKFRMKHQR